MTIELSVDERSVLQRIIETGGEDYDVWPALDLFMDEVKSLEERKVIGILGNGDIVILDDALEKQIRLEMIEEPSILRWKTGDDPIDGVRQWPHDYRLARGALRGIADDEPSETSIGRLRDEEDMTW